MSIYLISDIDSYSLLNIHFSHNHAMQLALCVSSYLIILNNFLRHWLTANELRKSGANFSYLIVPLTIARQLAAFPNWPIRRRRVVGCKIETTTTSITQGGVTMASVFPEAKIAVFTRASEPTRFSFYDIAHCVPTKTLDLGMRITRIESSEDRV